METNNKELWSQPFWCLGVFLFFGGLAYFNIGLFAAVVGLFLMVTEMNDHRENK